MHLQQHGYTVPSGQPYQSGVSDNGTRVKGGVMVDNVRLKHGDLRSELNKVLCALDEFVQSIFEVASTAIVKSLQFHMLTELRLQ